MDLESILMKKKTSKNFIKPKITPTKPKIIPTEPKPFFEA